MFPRTLPGRPWWHGCSQAVERIDIARRQREDWKRVRSARPERKKYDKDVLTFGVSEWWKSHASHQILDGRFPAESTSIAVTKDSREAARRELRLPNPSAPRVSHTNPPSWAAKVAEEKAVRRKAAEELLAQVRRVLIREPVLFSRVRHYLWLLDMPCGL